MGEGDDSTGPQIGGIDGIVSVFLSLSLSLSRWWARIQERTALMDGHFG